MLQLGPVCRVIAFGDWSLTPSILRESSESIYRCFVHDGNVDTHCNVVASEDDRDKAAPSAYDKPKGQSTYDVDFTAVRPIAVVSLPCGGPGSTTLRHVAHIEAGEIARSEQRARGVTIAGYIHSDVGGVSLDAFDSDTAPAGTAGAQLRGMVRPQDKAVATSVGQVFGESRGLVDVVPARR